MPASRHPLEQLLGAGLRERHAALAHGLEHGAGSLSMPITSGRGRRSDSASGSPTRPSPTTATSALLLRSCHSEEERLAAPALRGRVIDGACREVLTCEPAHEQGVVAGVATPQAAGLLRTAGRPTPGRCAASTPAPGGRGRRGSRTRRRRPPAAAPAGGDASSTSSAPAWAGRCRPTRPAAPRGVDRLRDLVLLGGASARGTGASSRRRSRAPGSACADAACEQLERLGRASPVEVDRRARGRRPRTEADHQLGPVDAGGLAMAERAQRPHERLPVGHRQRGAVDGRARRRGPRGRTSRG